MPLVIDLRFFVFAVVLSVSIPDVMMLGPDVHLSDTRAEEVENPKTNCKNSVLQKK
jgi:hypothetical protein